MKLCVLYFSCVVCYMTADINWFLPVMDMVHSLLLISFFLFLPSYAYVSLGGRATVKFCMVMHPCLDGSCILDMVFGSLQMSDTKRGSGISAS